MFVDILLLILGFVLLIKGADIFVDGASSTAQNFKVSKMLIGLTIIAFGTSLPELVTTIVSSKKGEQDLLVGNIIGSNIFNICVVLGIPVAIYGTITPSSFQLIDLFMLVCSSILLFIYSSGTRKITRFEGVSMLIIFVIYYIAVFLV